jgi:biopolymer transport protein ExbB/TolQ
MSETTKPNEPAVTEPEAPRPPAPAQADVKMPIARAAAANASRRATSDVRASRAFGLALPFYGAALLGAYVAPAGARSILLERGWPPHATMMLTSLAISILLLKAAGLRRQRRAFALDLLPEGERRIGPEAAARLVDHVESLRSLRGERSFLVERVARVLSQYAAHGDVAEATAANDADADADAASVAASFSMVKVIVWAMPILGLIGTVVGLSGAVGAFSHAMSGADQLDTIKDALREVTTGLAVAFDATFVALVASILVMLPMTWLQKSEDKLINDVDDYCVTNVLTRLGGHVEPAAAKVEQAPAAGIDAAEIRKVVLDAIASPLAEMLSANARLMDRMTEDRQALAGAESALVAQLSAFAAALQQAAPVMERAAGQLERATTEIGPRVERVTAELGRTTDAMKSSVEGMVAEIGRATAQMGPVGPSVERAVTQLEVATAVADQAATAAERAQDQLTRELGASRQLLSLLAAGLGAGDAPHVKPRHANGANGTNGANGASAARGD